ncbi:MAG: hypothetical protein KDK35_14470 [Leptospiraceae bacterium]|nr:hypothetical protein [Leptospiraceae bacterium]
MRDLRYLRASDPRRLARGVTALPVPVRLVLDLERSSEPRHLTPVGSYPRRVASGDVVARSDAGAVLVAPLPGIAEKDGDRIELRVEGSMQFASDGILEKIEAADDPVAEFLQTLDDLALFGLEERAVMLSSLLGPVFAPEGRAIVLARVDDSLSGACRSALWSRRAELALLGSFLERLLKIAGSPAQVLHYPRLSASAPRPRRRDLALFIPELITRRLLRDSELFGGLEEQRVAYIGPASLLAMLEGLFDGRPFGSRLVVLRSREPRFRRAGLKRDRLLRLYHGQSLSELLSEELGPAAGAGPVFLRRGSSIRNTFQPLTPEDRFSAFDDCLIELSSKPGPVAMDLPCTGCMSCQRICPVDAGPLALVEGRPAAFRSASCLECGLCTAICESRIDLMAKISAVRKESRSVVRFRR